MSDKEIVITEDVVIDTDCAKTWGVEVKTLSPLEQLGLAVTEDNDKILDNVIGEHTWKFQCRDHRRSFQLWEGCPESKITLKAGEKVILSEALANRLLLNRQAETTIAALMREKVVKQEYPFASQLDRCNALMESMGLPEMDKVGLEAIDMRGEPPLKGERGKSLPRRRGDKNLAKTLELSQDDIAEMRKLIKD